MDLESISKIVSSCKYGQYNLLEEELTVRYNKKAEQVLIYPFYRYNSPTNNGSCGELMNYTYLKIKAKHKDYWIARCTGNDPKFFRKKGDSHHFLLLYEKSLMKEEYTHKKNEILKILKHDPIIVDPSFNVIKKFTRSRYNINEIFNEGCPIGFSNSRLIENDDAVPLAINAKSEILYLSISLDLPEILCFGIGKSNSPIIRYRKGFRKLLTYR